MLKTFAEGITLCRIAAIKTAFKPGIALLGSAVSEAVRHHASLTLLLQTIVANRLRRIQRLFQIAGFQHSLLLHVVPPDAREAIRL